jgi:predicted metal-dependent peptidase
VFINPEYLLSLSPPQRVFVYAHEVEHAICRHAQRFNHYRSVGGIKDKPFDMQHGNVCADYVINAALVEQGVGMMNPDWLWADDVKGDDLLEDVYVRKWKERKQGGGDGSTRKGSGKAPKNAKGDPAAEANGGGFDQVLAPHVDPLTGREDLPTEGEFKEAIARAETAAKAMGNIPGSLARRVKEILDPQVDWREHLRMTVTNRLGRDRETWNRPNRRRIVLDPIVIMPGRIGYGADTVAVAVDTSGSIGEKELAVFMAEVGGILTDINPRRVIFLSCDARVHQYEELRSLDEAQALYGEGIKGGGGTSFVPVFERLREEDVVPDTLIYLTDLLGVFPSAAPTYPVIWAATTGEKVPFGEVVPIKF